MATGNFKDNNATEQVKHNLAPEGSVNKTDSKSADKAKDEAKRDPLDHDEDGRKGGVKKQDLNTFKAQTPEEKAQEEQKSVEEDRQKREAEIEASKKGTAVDGLGLPEKQGEILWQTGFNVGPRESGEKDKDWDKRWEEAENTVVAQAMQVTAGQAGIRPNGYQLIRDDNSGILRLNLVSADPDHPDPKRIGGLPNADGSY